MSENKLLDNVKKEYVVGIGLIVFAVLWMISNLLDLNIFRDLLMIVVFLGIIGFRQYFAKQIENEETTILRKIYISIYHANLLLFNGLIVFILATITLGLVTLSPIFIYVTYLLLILFLTIAVSFWRQFSKD